MVPASPHPEADHPAMPALPTAGHDSAGPLRRPSHPAGAEPPPDLEGTRRELEELDGQLVALLARRAAMARSAGLAKRSRGLPLVDPVQEAAVVRRAAGLARSTGLPEEEVRSIFWHLIALSRRIQSEGTRP